MSKKDKGRSGRQLIWILWSVAVVLVVLVPALRPHAYLMLVAEGMRTLVIGAAVTSSLVGALAEQRTVYRLGVLVGRVTGHRALWSTLSGEDQSDDRSPSGIR